MASDLIYREDAKDFVRHAYHKGLNPIDYIDEVPAADVRPVNNRYIDGNELFRRIAGHSYYKGDDILTRISLMQEGKSKNEDVKPADVRPVDKICKVQFEKLEQLEKLLPVRPGDVVYETDGIRVYRHTVRRIVFDCGTFAFDEDALANGNVFLTEREAEQAAGLFRKPEDMTGEN